MEISFNEYSPEQQVKLVTHLYSLPTFEEKADYIIEKTGFKYFDPQGVLGVRKPVGYYWWGIEIGSSKESTYVGNLYIHQNKDVLLKEKCDNLKLRLDGCKNDLKAKGLLETELKSIQYDVNNNDNIKKGYENEARNISAYNFYSEESVGTYHDVTLGAVYYNMETEITENLIAKFTEDGKDNNEQVIDMDLEIVSQRLVLMNELGILNHLISKYPDKLKNQPANLTAILVIIMDIPKNKKPSLAANVKHLLNNTVKTPKTDKALRNIKSQMLKIGIELP